MTHRSIVQARCTRCGEVKRTDDLELFILNKRKLKVCSLCRKDFFIWAKKGDDKRYRFSRLIQCEEATSERKDVRERVLKQAAKVCRELGVDVPQVTVLECQDLHSYGERVSGIHFKTLNRIYLNRKTLSDVSKYERLFAHEMSHSITRKLIGRRGNSHGPTWKRVMKMMGQAIPDKYNNNNKFDQNMFTTFVVHTFINRTKRQARHRDK